MVSTLTWVIIGGALLIGGYLLYRKFQQDITSPQALDILINAMSPMMARRCMKWQCDSMGRCDWVDTRTGKPVSQQEQQRRSSTNSC